ncbi:MAG: type II secretion system protein [Candidatus Levybacteria bacterium]|nr:type II secretion system protein [Candidatus Levybacteria bacterium]
MREKTHKGFTLIELLVVMMIIIAVGSIIAGIIVVSLRGGNRSVNVNEVRQTGEYTLSQMTKMVAFAKSFDGIGKLVLGNIVYETDCTTQAGVEFTHLKLTSFDNTQTTFICDYNATTIASQSASRTVELINSTKFNLDVCTFKCTQNSIATAPVIEINFTLSKNSPSTFVENKISIPFGTTVGFRNLAN